MKAFILICIMFITGCSTMHLKVKSQYEAKNGKGRLEYDKSYSTGSFPWICGATGIFFGGGCWAYLVLPMVPQENVAIKDAEEALKEKFGADAVLIKPTVIRDGWNLVETNLELNQ